MAHIRIQGNQSGLYTLYAEAPITFTLAPEPLAIRMNTGEHTATIEISHDEANTLLQSLYIARRSFDQQDLPGLEHDDRKETPCRP